MIYKLINRAEWRCGFTVRFSYRKIPDDRGGHRGQGFSLHIINAVLALTGSLVPHGMRKNNK